MIIYIYVNNVYIDEDDDDYDNATGLVNHLKNNSAFI